MITSALWFVRLCKDARDLVAVLDQRFQTRNRKIRRTHKNDLHVYNPPFCERHQWGHEKDAFANFFCYNVVEGNTVNYRNRGGEWWGCIAATPHVYMFRFSVKASMTGANP